MAVARMRLALAAAVAPWLALAQGGPGGAGPDAPGGGPGVGALWAVIALAVFGGALWYFFKKRPPRQQTPRT